jgi:hypothetical protein
MKTALAVAIAVWTLAAWGGRIGLLTSGEGLGAWARIGGSVVVGLFTALALVVPQLDSVRKPALFVFTAWTVALWARSLFVAWAGSGSLPFKLVHTVLAAGFFVLAGWAYAVATGSDIPTAPGEAHGGQDGLSEAAVPSRE